MKKITLLFFIMLSTTSFAESLISSQHTRITGFVGAPSWGGGDIAFTVETPASGCEGGFWVSASAPGIDRVLALLIAAKGSGDSSIFYGDTSRLWNGSSASFCHLHSFYTDKAL